MLLCSVVARKRIVKLCIVRKEEERASLYKSSVAAIVAHAILVGGCALKSEREKVGESDICKLDT